MKNDYSPNRFNKLDSIKIICNNCGKSNCVDFIFCKGCGKELRNINEVFYCRCGNPIKYNHTYCTNCGWPLSELHFLHDPVVLLSCDKDTATLLSLKNNGVGVLEVRFVIPNRFSDWMYFCPFNEEIGIEEKEIEMLLLPKERHFLLLFFGHEELKSGESRNVNFELYSRDNSNKKDCRKTWFPGNECERIMKPKIQVFSR